MATIEQLADKLGVGACMPFKDMEEYLSFRVEKSGLSWDKLKKEGVAHVTVSDYAPTRRELAAKLGADLVVDPAKDDLAAVHLAATGAAAPAVFASSASSPKDSSAGSSAFGRSAATRNARSAIGAVE